jgi:ammonia channel protein AmtB
MISGCCSICIDYWAALLIGFICGAITVTMLSLVKKFFIEWGFNDIFNIIIVHGIPGLLGAFLTAIMIGDIKKRADDVDYHYILQNDINRSNEIQAGIQIGAIFISLGISFISGIATGYLMKVSSCGRIEYYFTDSEFFENEKNIIDNLEQNQFYYGEINRLSLFQNKMDFPLPRVSDPRASSPNYN